MSQLTFCVDNVQLHDKQMIFYPMREKRRFDVLENIKLYDFRMNCSVVILPIDQLDYCYKKLSVVKIISEIESSSEFQYVRFSTKKQVTKLIDNIKAINKPTIIEIASIHKKGYSHMIEEKNFKHINVNFPDRIFKANKEQFEKMLSTLTLTIHFPELGVTIKPGDTYDQINPVILNLSNQARSASDLLSLTSKTRWLNLKKLHVYYKSGVNIMNKKLIKKKYDFKRILNNLLQTNSNYINKRQLNHFKKFLRKIIPDPSIVLKDVNEVNIIDGHPLTIQSMFDSEEMSV